MRCPPEICRVSQGIKKYAGALQGQHVHGGWADGGEGGAVPVDIKGLECQGRDTALFISDIQKVRNFHYCRDILSAQSRQLLI